MDTTLPLLSRAPRAIPFSTRIVVLLGAPFSAFGWFFLAFGMMLAWVFAGHADWSSVIYFHGELQRTRGTLTSTEQTRFSEGGSKTHRGTPIYAYHYEFTFNGTEYQGVSYRVGGGLGLSVGTVSVEFPAGQPARSRLTGMRRAPLGASALLVLLFPAIGLASVVGSVIKGRREAWLLAHGELARGRLILKEPTRATTNKRPVYKLTFEFTDAFGEKRSAITKTHLTERLEDDRMELILYQTHRPFRTALLDTLPGQQGFTADGAIRPNGFGRVFRALAGPILALLIVAGGLLIRMVL